MSTAIIFLDTRKVHRKSHWWLCVVVVTDGKHIFCIREKRKSENRLWDKVRVTVILNKFNRVLRNDCAPHSRRHIFHRRSWRWRGNKCEIVWVVWVVNSGTDNNNRIIIMIVSGRGSSSNWGSRTQHTKRFSARCFLSCLAVASFDCFVANETKNPCLIP